MDLQPLNHYAIHFGINTPSYTHTIFLNPFSWRIGYWMVSDGGLLCQFGPIKILTSPTPVCGMCAEMRREGKKWELKW